MKYGTVIRLLSDLRGNYTIDRMLARYGRYEKIPRGYSYPDRGGNEQGHRCFPDDESLCAFRGGMEGELYRCGGIRENRQTCPTLRL